MPVQALSPPASTTTVTPKVVHDPITALVSTVYSSSAIELTWTPPATSNGGTGYDIYRDGVKIDSLSGITTNSYNDTGLTGSTSYVYEVVVTGAETESESVSVTTTTDADGLTHSTVTNLVASAHSQTAIQLLWTPIIGNIASGKDGGVPELTNPAPGSVFEGSTATLNWISNGLTLSDWYLRIGDTEGSVEYEDIRFTDSSVLTHVVSGLPVDGRDIHVEFSYKTSDGTWVTENHLYSAYDASAVYNDGTGYEIYRDSVLIDTLTGIATSYYKDTGLVAGTTYVYEVVTIGPNNDSPVATTSTSISTTDANLPTQTTRDTYWSSEGFGIAWASTPSVAEVGNTVQSYVEGSHFSNDQTLQVYLDRATVPDLIKLDPLEGTPCISSRIEPTDTATGEEGKNGIQVIGNQFGGSGLSCSEVVYSSEIYSPLPANGGLLHPVPETGSGQYIGLGHHVIAGLNITELSGGSTWNDFTTSYRIILTASGYFAVYAYDEDQREVRGGSNGQGGSGGGGATIQPISPNTIKYSDLENTFILAELRVKLNTPSTTANGEIGLYINGVLLREWTGRKIIGRDDMLPKGFGIFTQGGGTYDSTGTTTYHRNFKVYSK